MQNRRGRSKALYSQFLRAVLMGVLFCGSLLNQAVAAPERSKTATNFHLKGVLISETGRSALVNRRSVREGDRVNGIDILAIDEAGVRVRAGAQELSLRVGAKIAGVDSTHTPLRRMQSNENRQHTVQPGETLSGIALRYRNDDVTMNQMMTALFRTNGQAFDGNINMLYEGATLRLPEANALYEYAPKAATAEVALHTARWQSIHDQRIELAESSNGTTYGPVASGETLSGIAARIVHAGTTIDQMMIALFDANAHAFDNNINVLYEGVVLRVPGGSELSKHGPEMAAADVLRHAKAWHAEYEHDALLTVAHNIIASQ